MNTEKEALRKRILRIRKAAGPSETARMSRMIQEALFASEFYSPAKSVMTYVSIPGEVQTGRIMLRALRDGKKLSVPSLMETGQIIPSLVWDPESELAPGRFGVPEPLPGKVRPYHASGIDLVIVPGVAFDREGNRLGMGGGYYDAFLSSLSGKHTVVGLAFGFQVVSSVPWEKHDSRMDYLITEDSVIDCSGREIPLE